MAELKPPAPRAHDQGASYLRATALLTTIIDDFFRAAGLQPHGIPTPFDRAVNYWLEGPELVTLPFLSSELKRQAVRRLDGKVPDDFQQLFLLEFQAALSVVLGALEDKPDDLLDIVSQGLIDHAVANACAWILAGEAEPETIKIGRLFQQNLLWALRELLLSTYEGSHATVLVVVIPERVTAQFRWTELVQDGISFLRKTKIARALSDGESTSFVFSPTGEFFGFFHLPQERLSSGDVPNLVEWQILHPQTLTVRLGAQRRLELFCGSWRLIDDHGALESLVAVELSFSDRNRILWELALRLSNQRRGALILVVHDLSGLLEQKCCKPEEINRLEEPSRLQQLAEHYKVSETARTIGVGLSNPKEVLLEQIRGKSAGELGIDLLVRLASVDGATIVLSSGEVCGFGVVLALEGDPSLAPTEGARTRAALLGSRFGTAIKVSEDGPISIYHSVREIFPGRRTSEG